MFFKVPHLNQSLFQFGGASSEMITGTTHRVLLWNIYKGLKKSFSLEIEELSQEKDFLLLQEVVFSPKNNHFHGSTNLESYLWHIGLSFNFMNSNMGTGVALGSIFPQTQVEAFRPDQRELYFLTPKMAVISKFNFIDQGLIQELMVVNCHALNFTLNSAFLKSIELLSEKLARHKGPLIVAGDFNTWGLSRWDGLLHIFKNIRLEHIPPDEDRRFLKLDHVFVRGVRILSARVLMNVKGSDHYPIEFEFSLTHS